AGATNNGHLNDVPLLGPKHDWYKITLGANQVLDVSMTASEPTANLDLWIVDLWFYKKYAHGGLPFYLNFSIKGAGESEQCSAGATYAGDYYILVWAFTGFSDYTMTTSITTGNPDNDNVLENAKQITYQTSLNDRLDQSFDHYDWYKVTVAQNEWTKVSFSISGPNLDLYNISVFDSNKNYVTGRFNTQDGSYFVIEPPYTPTNSLQGHISINLTTGGDYYVCIMPVETRDTFKNKGTVVSSGYTIIFSYPNHRPEKTVESLPDISLKEPPGAPSEAIVNLSNYFKDPDPREVDPLKFYAKDYSPLNVLQNLTNKEIFIIYPNEDWCGEKTFTFGARDSYNEFVEAKVKVIVECTNDIPRINYTKFKENITMDEDTENRDIVLTDIFYDPDGTELVFSFENRTIPVSIEEAKIVKLGPVKRWFGTEVVSFTAKDGNQTENSVSVNVTVLHINHAPEINKDANFTITIEEDQTKAKEIALKEYIFDIDEEYANDDLSYEILDKDIIKDLDVSIKNVTGKKVLSILPITPNWYGNKEIEIRAKDLLGREVKGTFTIIVEEVNDPCVIMNFYPKEYDKKFKEGDANTKFSLVTEDLDEDKIYYIWELIKGEEVILNSTGETFTLETKENYAMSGDYKLRVSISDKRGGNASMEWNITVEDVNRLPDKDKTLIKSPKPQEQFKYGEIITLSGLSTDPDGDNLTYKWVYLTAKGNVTLGTGSTIQYGKLKPGTYTIIMVVDDGRGGIVEKSVTIKVYSPPKKPEPIPGFEGLLLLLAVGIVLLILRRRAR
ncbi:MAG: PKD domain-containing protein, partial [Candidatus Thermoplasmatota archaeon]